MRLGLVASEVEPVESPVVLEQPKTKLDGDFEFPTDAARRLLWERGELVNEYGRALDTWRRFPPKPIPAKKQPWRPNAEITQ